MDTHNLEARRAGATIVYTPDQGQEVWIYQASPDLPWGWIRVRLDPLAPLDSAAGFASEDAAEYDARQRFPEDTPQP